MAGLASAIVFAIFTTLTLALIGYSLVSLSTQINLLTYYAGHLETRSALERCEVRVERLKICDSNSTVRAVVVNRSCEPIAVKDFDKMDLIVVYRTSGGGVRAVWLPHDPGRMLPEGWRPLSVTYFNGTELMNPTDPSLTSGLWDKDEQLEIEAWLGEKVEAGERPLLILYPPRGGEVRG